MDKSSHDTTRNETQKSIHSSFSSILDDSGQSEIISGVHTNKEKETLSRLAKQTTQGAIVEIGSFLGASTIILARAANENCKVFAIDPHVGVLSETDEGDTPFIGDTWEQFKRNIHAAGVSDKITALRLKSEEAVTDWTNPIGLLFIDGSHRYEDVKKDILLWRPYLLPGSTVLFHDLWMVGVRKTIYECVLFNSTFSNFHFTRCCMLSATFLPNKTLRQKSQRIYWYMLLRVRGAIEKVSLLRRFLLWVLRHI